MAGVGSAAVMAAPQSLELVSINSVRLAGGGEQSSSLAKPVVLAMELPRGPASDSQILIANTHKDKIGFASTAFEMRFAATNAVPHAVNPLVGARRQSIRVGPSADQFSDAALMVWLSQRRERIPVDLEINTGDAGSANYSGNLQSQPRDLAISDLDYGVCTNQVAQLDTLRYSQDAEFD